MKHTVQKLHSWRSETCTCNIKVSFSIQKFGCKCILDTYFFFWYAPFFLSTTFTRPSIIVWVKSTKCTKSHSNSGCPWLRERERERENILPPIFSMDRNDRFSVICRNLMKADKIHGKIEFESSLLFLIFKWMYTLKNNFCRKKILWQECSHTKGECLIIPDIFMYFLASLFYPF